jgi:hypothetical protein
VQSASNPRIPLFLSGLLCSLLMALIQFSVIYLSPKDYNWQRFFILVLAIYFVLPTMVAFLITYRTRHRWDGLLIGIVAGTCTLMLFFLGMYVRQIYYLHFPPPPLSDNDPFLSAVRKTHGYFQPGLAVIAAIGIANIIGVFLSVAGAGLGAVSGASIGARGLLKGTPTPEADMGERMIKGDK